MASMSPRCQARPKSRAVRSAPDGTPDPTITPTTRASAAAPPRTGMARCVRRLRRSEGRSITRAVPSVAPGERSDRGAARGRKAVDRRAGGRVRPALTAVDWIIVGFTVFMGLWGFAQGLIVGGLSLVGFVAGAFVGSRLGPALLSEGSHSPYAPLSALVGAILLGGILASGLEVLGFRLRRRLGEHFGALDGLGGAELVGCLGLALAWIVGAVALQTPGARKLREPIQRSTILRKLNAVLPPSGPILKALARFDPFPRIQGPPANVRPPNSAIARDPQVK